MANTKCIKAVKLNRPLPKTSTLTVEIKVSNILMARLWLGKSLISVAAYVLGSGVEFIGIKDGEE